MQTTMDNTDFDQLNDFVFDASTPNSDEDIEQEPAQSSPATSGRAPEGRIIRRRARKACVACHKRYMPFYLDFDCGIDPDFGRKVRCDLMSRGTTCTNCRLDGVTCVVRTGRVY